MPQKLYDLMRVWKNLWSDDVPIDIMMGFLQIAQINQSLSDLCRAGIVEKTDKNYYKIPCASAKERLSLKNQPKQA